MDLEEFVPARVLSTDPLVTISKRYPEAPAGIAGYLPDLFRGRQALHLVLPTWNYENLGRIDYLAGQIRALSDDLANNRFVVTANSEYEAYLLGQAGVSALLGNELMFIDERAYFPEPDGRQPQPAYDAVYNARFHPFKRHELARDVESLLFLYDHTAPFDEQHFDDMRQLMPRAVFGNHVIGNGEYVPIVREEMRKLLATCRVGLCLSRSEGAMRASMEYMLCGLPVVSTRSIGGRDRYFCGPYSMIVDDNPAAVADAVRRLASRGFDRKQVRGFAGNLLAFDRHNFIRSLNRVIRAHFKSEFAFDSFARFAGDVEFRPVRDFLEALDQGASLPAAGGT